MKREFLQNLKVGEEALPKEVIDAIMDENGRDITKAKADAVKPYSDYEDIKKERDTLKTQQGDGIVDGKTAAQWKEAHDNAVADHQKELDVRTRAVTQTVLLTRVRQQHMTIGRM